MIGHLLSTMEIKSDLRKDKLNRNKGLCIPCLWNKTKYRVACVLRKIGVNGHIMRMASVLKRNIYRKKTNDYRQKF